MSIKYTKLQTFMDLSPQTFASLNQILQALLNGDNPSILHDKATLIIKDLPTARWPRTSSSLFSYITRKDARIRPSLPTSSTLQCSGQRKPRHWYSKRVLNKAPSDHPVTVRVVNKHLRTWPTGNGKLNSRFTFKYLTVRT